MTTRMTLPGLIPQWTLGDRLRKARELAGLNQSEMAEQIGIARNSVANYESGKYQPPRPVLIAWAFRTGVALDWLVNGEGGDDGDAGTVNPPRSNHRPRHLALDLEPAAAVTTQELLSDFRKQIHGPRRGSIDRRRNARMPA